LLVVEGVVGTAASASVGAVLGEGSGARHGVDLCEVFEEKIN
jgi:hypothetical protein